MTACPLFVELCAGTAAVSLRLARARARPPVSRMGAKTGYADAILGLAGLAPGQGAGHYLWCEPDAGCRLLLEAYRDAALAKAAADIIRGWAGEDPRALWERLRAEGPPLHVDTPQGSLGYAPGVARVVVDIAWSIGNDSMQGGFKRTNAYGEWFAPQTVDKLASRTEALPTLTATIAPDARAVDPREVARWLCDSYLSYGQAPGRGFRATAGGCWPDDPPDVTTQAQRLERLAGNLPATILPDAHAADPGPALPAGTVALLDPPYVGTTPYANDLPRADVVALARRWAAAGALVMVCEQEPIPELVAEGWQARDIAHARRGQARTFSRQTREVVTMNRAPVHVPAEQVGLFGGSP